MDNSSDGQQGERLQKYYGNESKVTVILNEKNVGFTRANQQLFDLLQDDPPPYVALLNNDTEVDPGWLEELLKVAQQNEASVISSKLILHHNRRLMDNAGHRMLNTGEIIPVGHGDQIEKHEELKENLGACAAACLYDFSMIEKIGFFDSYFSTGYEDAEFGVRAYLAGYRCIFAPGAKVYHKSGRSIKKVFNRQYALMIQNAIWYTNFKLMPWQVLLINFPFIVAKQVFLLMANFLFLRWRYLSIQLRSWSNFFGNIAINWQARKRFQPLIRRTWWEVLWRQTFFLRYDFKRFVDVFIKQKSSALDEYGGE